MYNSLEKIFYSQIFQTVTKGYDINIFDSVLLEEKFSEIPLSRKKHIISEIKQHISELYDIEVSKIYNYVTLMSLRKDLLKASQLNKFKEKLLLQEKITELEQKIFSTDEEYEVTWGD